MLVLPLLLALGAAPATPPAPARLHIRDMAAFDPVAGPAPLRGEYRSTSGTRYSIVQYVPGEERKVEKAIRAAGGRVIGPVVEHAMLVGGVPTLKLKAMPGVRFAGPFEPGHKLSGSLRAAAASTKQLELVVSVLSDPEGTAKQIARLGGRATRAGQAGQALRVSIPAGKLPALAALPEVHNVEPATMARFLLNVAPVLVGVRTTAAPPWASYQGLDGTGQILGVYDSGGDTGDPNTLVLDLRARVQGDVVGWSNRYQPVGWQDRVYDGTPASHGTQVLDIAVGNGTSSGGGLLLGVAPGATAVIRSTLADADGGTPGFIDLPLALGNAYDAGARVHNDSWDPATGNWPNLVGVNNQYTQQGSGALDQFAYGHPEMLIVTAAGNEGPNANTIGTLSTAKSSLAVGNAGNEKPSRGAPNNLDATPTDQIEPTSSRGPAVTGQLKPDVCAPGASIAVVCSQATLANGDCPSGTDVEYTGQPLYEYSTGTSFSAPVVSGMALLLRQAFAREFVRKPPVRGPSGMLIKAMLINGAASLYPNAPDNNQGWGEVNLQRSLTGTAGGGTVAWYDSLYAPGGSFQFVGPNRMVIFDGVQFTPGQPVAITLTWYDPPDALYAGALVNDLDLTLQDGGTVYRGGPGNIVGGVTQLGGNADRVNTTEKIVLPVPPGGAWSIVVTSYSMTAPLQNQPFAVVVTSLQSQAPTSDLSRFTP
ncbi:MAG TPA: S8 family serine peptidase [Myxococcaceae bacterium]